MSWDADADLKMLFLDEVKKALPSAVAAQQRFEREPESREPITELAHFFHRIAGMAGSVGFPLLGNLACVSEAICRGIESGNIQDRGAMCHPLDQAVRGIQSSVNTLATTVTAAATTVSPGPTSNATVSSAPGAATATAPSTSTAVAAASSSAASSVPTVMATAASATTPRLPSASRASGPAPDTFEVLVIDDDPAAARIIERYLRDASIPCSLCTDATVALSVVRNELPDLIVMDLSMPQVNGFDLCRSIRQNARLSQIPILFVSHNTDGGERQEKLRGVDTTGIDFLAKPFTGVDVVSRVRAQLQRLSEMRSMIVRDPLTRLYNREYFESRLEEEVLRIRRTGESLSVALVDVDAFTGINDTFGRAAGDGILEQLGSILGTSFRSRDVVARYGGQRFGILYGQTGLAESSIVSERIRTNLGRHRFSLPSSPDAGPDSAPPHFLTVSIGLTQFEGTDGAKNLLQRADTALAVAKSRGRNQVQTDRGTPAEAIAAIRSARRT